MIGKIPEEPNGNYNNVNYYKGLYFIINFHEKRMDVFRVPCFQSDLIMAFTNCIDRQRITAWINSIENLDDFIYDNKDNFTHSIDRDSFSNIIKDCNNE